LTYFHLHLFHLRPRAPSIRRRRSSRHQHHYDPQDRVLVQEARFGSEEADNRDAYDVWSFSTSNYNGAVFPTLFQTRERWNYIGQRTNLMEKMDRVGMTFTWPLASPFFILTRLPLSFAPTTTS
jgi:hypothetical protein